MSNLLGPESHSLFSILGINTDWLAKPIEQWTEQPGYKEAEKFVRTVKVVNDTSERGVKLISEFATIITSDPEQRVAGCCRALKITGSNILILAKKLLDNDTTLITFRKT